MRCPKCHQEIKEIKTLEIEGFEVTIPEKCRTYKEAVDNCPEGFRLPVRWELFKIFEKMENRKKLTDNTFMFFWSSLIEDSFSKGLCLYRSLGVGSNNGYLADSYSDGRVIYVRDKK